MSADKVPIYPRTTSNASQATNSTMATTQLPPLAPHVASRYLPSTRALSQSWFPPAALAPLPPVPFAWRSGQSFIQPPMPAYAPTPSQMTASYPLQPRPRPPVMSVQSLLQSEPSPPPQSAVSQQHSNRASPRSIPSPHTFSTQLSIQSPRQFPPSRETTDQVHRLTLLGESAFSAGSPIEYTSIPHRGSESSQHSSLTSSSSFAPYRSTQSQLPTATTAVDTQDNQNSRFTLKIRQQPVAARACGLGERDRRVVDPPPIVQLCLSDFDPTKKEDVQKLQWQWNVVQCTLWSIPKSGDTHGQDVTSVTDPNNPSRKSRRLMGSVVSSPFVGVDPEVTESGVKNARLAAFFIFHDLSCRQNGTYRLKFAYTRVDAMNAFGEKLSVLAEVMSDPFEVYSAKDFPGMRPSTDLTKELKRQGASVQVKKGNDVKYGKRPPKRGSDEPDDDSEPSASDGSETGKKVAGKRRKKKS